MSTNVNTSKTEATFMWILGAFASFAVLFWVIQTGFAKPGVSDPRAPERIANKTEITEQQEKLLSEMGLADLEKKNAVFNKAVQFLKSRPEGVSSQVVPGSPTQLKQAAEPDQSAAPQN